MVDLSKRLEQIREMVDRGEYFTINRARQYGKTTTLHALGDFLGNDYTVVSLDFHRRIYLHRRNHRWKFWSLWKRM